MAESMLLGDLAFYLREDVPAGIAWWASAEPDHPISVVIEPAGPVDTETRERVEAIAARTAKVIAEARAWLVAQLRGDEWNLTDDERAALADEAFEDPEVIVWTGREWMIRFESPVLEMAADYGIGVLFDGDDPIAVEDLSGEEDDDHTH